jgi:hypothetical protein
VHAQTAYLGTRVDHVGPLLLPHLAQPLADPCQAQEVICDDGGCFGQDVIIRRQPRRNRVKHRQPTWVPSRVWSRHGKPRLPNALRYGAIAPGIERTQNAILDSRPRDRPQKPHAYYRPSTTMDGVEAARRPVDKFRGLLLETTYPGEVVKQRRPACAPLRDRPTPQHDCLPFSYSWHALKPAMSGADIG